MDGTFYNYSKDLFIEDIIYENGSSIDFETINTTFTVYHTFKETLSVLKILLQRAMFDIDYLQAENNECKVAILSEFLSIYHHQKRR